MEVVEVEAVEDRTRAEGGHAVILLRGVASAEGASRFRLRPIETEGLATAAVTLAEQDFAPLEVRTTGDGLALSIGPELTEHPALVPGSAVEITLPDARVRGEFVWPAIAPLARPKRRYIMTRRVSGDPLPQRIAMAPAATPPAARDEPSVPMPAPVYAQVSGPVSGPATTTLSTRAAASLPAAETRPARPQSSVDMAPARDAETTEPEASIPPPRRQRVVGAPSPRKPRSAEPFLSPELASRAMAAVERELPAFSAAARELAVAVPRRDEPVASTARSIVIAANEIQAPATPAPIAPPPSVSPTTGPRIKPWAARKITAGSAAALAVAVLVGGQIVAMRALDLSISKRAPAGTVEVPMARAASAAPVAGPLAQPGIYDVIATGSRSPRGVVADGVSPAKALQLAHNLLHGPEASRDPEEAIYWLKRYVGSTAGAEHARIALTQLGSAYAQPVRGQRDFASARMAWELAGAFGDPVAMCFLGAMHEHGLGIAVTKGIAGVWYERAAAFGRSCASIPSLAGDGR